MNYIDMNITFKKKIHHKIQSLQIARFGQIFAKRAVPKIARAEPSWKASSWSWIRAEPSRAQLGGITNGRLIFWANPHFFTSFFHKTLQTVHDFKKGSKIFEISDFGTWTSWYTILFVCLYTILKSAQFFCDFTRFFYKFFYNFTQFFFID